MKDENETVLLPSFVGLAGLRGGLSFDFALCGKQRMVVGKLIKCHFN